jgi:hypothetical protein
MRELDLPGRSRTCSPKELGVKLGGFLTRHKGLLVVQHLPYLRCLL